MRKIKIIVCLIVCFFSIGVISPLVSANDTEKKWDDQVKYIPNDVDENFGCSVFIDNDYAIIGSEWDTDNIGKGWGSAYIFQRSGSTWSQQVKLLSPAAEDSIDFFGCSVSIDGDYAIIGAEGDSDKGSMAGSAYIFKRSGSTWIQEAKLTANDGAEYDSFGKAVAIDGDKAIAVVGAIGDDDNGDKSGSAYVFKKEGTAWVQKAKLKAPDGAEDDRFGNSVSIDGMYILVGSYWDDDNGEWSGSAYMFKQDDSTWTLQTKLIASDGASGSNFGCSVFINGDYALIGAEGDKNKGSAYIFKRNDSTWTQQAKLTANDGSMFATDYFGCSVSLCGDYALIGAHSDKVDGNSSGSAHIFKRSGSTWIQDVKLTPSDGAENFWFGKTVSICENYVLIGSQENDDNLDKSKYTGSIYFFGEEVSINDENKDIDDGNNDGEGGNKNSGGNGSPGFELIPILIAIGLIICFKRREKFKK